MVRKPLNLFLPLKRLQHLPFRITSRILLTLTTVIVLCFVCWMIYRIFFLKVQTSPIILEQRSELLQTDHIEELELYEENTDIPPFPAPIFPTNDNLFSG